MRTTPNSNFLAIVQLDPAAGSLQVVWNAEPNISRRVQTSATLLPDSWTAVGTATTQSLSASTMSAEFTSVPHPALMTLDSARAVRHLSASNDAAPISL
jgi:hypothetical protein